MTEWRANGQNPNGFEDLKDSLMDTLRPILVRDKEREEEEALRKRFPALQLAWENYRMLLEICRSNNPELPVEEVEGASR